MLILPTWITWTVIFYIGFPLASAFAVYADYRNLFNGFRYSKFSNRRGIPSRVAMVVLYSLPILAATWAARAYLPIASVIQMTVFDALLFHFAKRVLESIFLHKYSGTATISATMFVAIFYSFVAGMISYLNAQTIPAMDGLFYAGLIFFALGEAGNFYHHKLLADLRKDADGYHIPRGGLFEYVTCPHYFFELITWLGVALLSRHLFAFMALATMTAYLATRSAKTRQWYQGRFADYPKERKRIIPFLF